MQIRRGRSFALASVAITSGVVGLPAFAQDVPSTVEPGVIEQEFRALPERYANGAVTVPPASGPAAPPGAENERFVLNALDVDGVTAFSDESIRSVYAAKLSQEISLAELFGIAQAITRLYADAGYPLSVAFVPAQQIAAGAARIMVYEGYVAEVEIAGDPGSAAPLLEQLAEQLKAERPLSSRALERYLLLANDIPGVKVQAVIDRAGGEPGAVKVIFAVERQRANFALSLNNRGSRALGPGRVQLSAALNGLARPGDRLRADLVQTTDSDELTFVSAGYEVPLGADGFRLGGWASYSDSDPGTPLLDALAFNSDGWTAAIEGSYPLIRSRAHNLVVGGSIEHKDLESRFDDIVNSHDVLWLARANLSVDTARPNGAVSSVFLQYTRGLDIGDATQPTDPNTSRAGGGGEFDVLMIDAAHIHPLPASLELALSGRLQLASRKLLASEECGYGGAGMGRAFDNHEISGDYCLLGAAEVRREPGVIFGELAAAPYGFFDFGEVRLRGDPQPGQDESDTGQSIGAGVRFNVGDALSAYVEYARPMTHDVALEGDRDARVFFGLTARH